MLLRKKYWQLSVVLALCAPVSAAAVSFEIPVSEAMANTLVRAYFPQALNAGSLNLSAHKPQVFILEGNRVGLSAHLNCAGQCGGGNNPADSEAAVLVSAAIAFDAQSRELVLLDPTIDSLVFFQHNRTSREARRAIYQGWERHVANPAVIDSAQLGESELLTRYLQDIVIRDGAAYFIYGWAN